MAAHFVRDIESDESESALLLSQSAAASDPMHNSQLSNEAHQAFDIPFTTRNKMPSGKRFVLNSDAVYPSKPRCVVFLCIIIILACSWLLINNTVISVLLSYTTLLITFLFIVYYVTGICLYYKKEHWSTFIMIINAEQDTFHIIDQSNYKDCRISSVGRLNDLSLSIKKVSDTEAYVMIDESRFNTKYVRLEEAQKFMTMIEEYLRDLWHHEYINEQYLSGDILEKVESEDCKYDRKMLNKGLNQLIYGMMNGNDSDRRYDGQKLDEWFQRESYGLLKEYKQLLKQRDDERERFEKYMNFEPRFDEDYIAKMLLVKCNVMEILSD